MSKGGDIPPEEDPVGVEEKNLANDGEESDEYENIEDEEGDEAGGFEDDVEAEGEDENEEEQPKGNLTSLLLGQDDAEGEDDDEEDDYEAPEVPAKHPSPAAGDKRVREVSAEDEDEEADQVKKTKV